MDKYAKFSELDSLEVEGKDYRIEISDRPLSKAIVFTPHGGGIEPGTSEIVRKAAGADLSMYLFEGKKKPNGNSLLHIASHHFDEPQCVALIARMSIVVAIHGCKGPKSRICIGGLDKALKDRLSEDLSIEKLPVVIDCPNKYSGLHPMNICNRSARHCGAQLEISLDLRTGPFVDRIAAAVHRAIERYTFSP